jgi:hypothetical protein
MIMPAAQKPHWKACAFRKACCVGCSAPSFASPSRGHFAPGGAEGWHQAGMKGHAVEPHRAGAAIAGIAALLDAEHAPVTQKGAQELSRRRLGGKQFAVDVVIHPGIGRAGGTRIRNVGMFHLRAPG